MVRIPNEDVGNEIKTEAQLFESGVWTVGYDKVVLEEIYKDLQGRVGTSIR